MVPRPTAPTISCGRWKAEIKSARCPAENLSMSRNIGIEAAAGEFVAFMDDDAVAHPGWLTNAIPLFEDPRAAAVGGYTIDNTGVRFQCMKPFCDRYGNSYFPSPMIDERAFCFPGSPIYPSLLGTNSMFRTTHLEEIGGFDDAYAYLLDETDVCLRLIDAGHQIRFEPKALIYHQFAESHIRDPRRIPRNHYAPAASRAYFIMRFGLAANPEKALAELQRYKTDIAWSDRWFLDHNIIDNTAYFALRQGFEWGIADGIRKAQTRTSPLGHLNRQAVCEPFLKFGAERRAMTICFVSQGYPPANNAGIAQWTAATARSLADLGHAVHVVTRATDGEEAMRFEQGVWVHECAAKDEQTELIAARYDLPPNIAEWCARVDRELTKIKSFGLDIVSFPIWDVEAMTCLDRSDFATVLTLHTTYRLARPFKPEWTERPIYGAFMVDRVIRAETECLKRAAFIHANSKAIVKDIEQAYELKIAQKSEVIYRGTKDLGRGLTKPKPKSGAPLEALYVGRFELRKGFDILVKAIAATLRMNSTVRFSLVGDAMRPPRRRSRAKATQSRR